MPVIRRIRPGDGPKLRDVRLRALKGDPDSFGSSYEREVDRPPDAWGRRAIQSSTGYQQCLVVAEHEEVFVGMAGAYTPSDEPRERRLFGMWVAPEARQAGIGSRLVEEIVDWSSQGGAEEIHLWVVESNELARRLYERAGFAETGNLQPLASKPSLSEIQMALRLDPN